MRAFLVLVFGLGSGAARGRGTAAELQKQRQRKAELVRNCRPDHELYNPQLITYHIDIYNMYVMFAVL